jgi:hypothetical protein
MDLEFYDGFLEDSEAVDVDVMEVVELHDEDDLDDIYFQAELEVDDETYRLRILEDESPSRSKRSNYEVKIERKISQGERHTWWHQEEATYNDKMGRYFKRNLKDFMQDELSFELDNNQTTL